MRQAARLVVTVAAFGLLVTGCTDDPAPVETTPASTPSPTPSLSPTPTPAAPTPPQRPEAMSTNDEAGAVAAAQYFMGDLYVYAYASGDATELAHLSDDECSFCNNVLTSVAAMSTDGESSHGSPATFSDAYGTTITPGTRFTATMNATQGAIERRDADGSVIDTSEGGRYTLHFAIAWDQDWTILEVDATPVDGADN